MASCWCRPTISAEYLKGYQKSITLIKTGRLNRKTTQILIHQKKRKEEKLTSTCEIWVQVQIQVHIQSIVNPLYASWVFITLFYYHYISSKNRQQISTSPQPYQKIPVLVIICTTTLSVNQILSVDLITVNIVLCFVFIALHYFMLFGLMATIMKIKVYFVYYIWHRYAVAHFWAKNAPE